MTAPAFAHAAEIERSLELMAERCEDPAPLVYGRVFAAHPQVEAQFWRDTNGTIRGEMLARTFSAILDFVGDRLYADHLIKTEVITHEGYEVPREVFSTFFGFVAEAVREVLGPDWTPATETAWREMLAEIQRYLDATPRVGAPA
ncbi:globin [Phenylobacterium kunshanense]|uniref:Globin n=1 Tax=Phenylobacterium kunshanense TaxID=1445034 RepID=A0A328B8V2_9CAUL|nr:globin [Phenylobacterium kunshanense]RAK62851.1 globin [Phenylobacterium kunshanense]